MMAGLSSLLRLDPMFSTYQKIASGAQKMAPATSPEVPKLPATPGHSGTGPEVKNAVLCPQCPAAQGCAAPRGVPVLAACGHLADMEVRSAAKLINAAKLVSVSWASELSCIAALLQTFR